MDEAGIQLQLPILSPVAAQWPEEMPAVDLCPAACGQQNKAFSEFLAAGLMAFAEIDRPNDALPKAETSMLPALLQPTVWPELRATFELDMPVKTREFVDARPVPQSAVAVTFQAEQHVFPELPGTSPVTNVEIGDKGIEVQFAPSTFGRAVSLNQKPVGATVESLQRIATDQIQPVESGMMSSDLAIPTDSPPEMARPGRIKTIQTYPSHRAISPPQEALALNGLTRAQTQPWPRPVAPTLERFQPNVTARPHRDQGATPLAPPGESFSLAGAPVEYLVELSPFVAREKNGVANETPKMHSSPISQALTSLPSIEPRSSSLVFDASVPVSPEARPAIGKALVHQVAEAILPHHPLIQKDTPYEEIRVRVYPAELGQLQIVVGGEPDHLRARIIATELVTAELLLREKPYLVAALKEQGIDLPDVDISHRDAHDRQPTPFTHAPPRANNFKRPLVEVLHQVDTNFPKLPQRNSLLVDIVA